jgi:hypothetical protein
VGACDCLFTPINDDYHDLWVLPTFTNSPYDWLASWGWKGTTYSYLNRGWCRVEMFYGSNIPVTQGSEQRQRKMRAGLLYHHLHGRRPHYLYGSKFQAESLAPHLLPPLQNSYFEEYHPVKGNLTVASDKEKIIQLVKDLEPYMRKVVVGLVYDDDSDSDAVTRKGKHIYPSGSVYVGEFMNDKKHGYGKHEYPDGSVYEGQYAEGNKDGHGKFTYADGSVYEGDWKYDRIHGQGRYIYTTGEMYQGKYVDGRRNGHGKFIYADGSVYEGEYDDGAVLGRGRYGFAKPWKDVVRHGIGRSTSTNGTITLREYLDGKLISERPVDNAVDGNQEG